MDQTKHLRIKAFYGTTPTPCRPKSWIAVCVYVLVAIVKKELRLKCSMYQSCQILSLSLFEKSSYSSKHLRQLFCKTKKSAVITSWYYLTYDGTEVICAMLLNPPTATFATGAANSYSRLTEPRESSGPISVSL